MQVKIPEINNQNEYKIIDNKDSIVLIGANGSGKTRLSVWIEENNQNVFRVSAQKTLTMASQVSSTDLDRALKGLYYGNENTESNNEEWNKKLYRWKKSPNTALLDDFDKLMVYLFSEHFEKSIEFREQRLNGNNEFSNKTKLDLIKEIWEKIVSHRKLKIEAGKVIVLSNDNSQNYSCSELSDGEREIFYFLGEVLSAPSNCIIIIDEPENHLHDLILDDLWDNLEELRADCTFVYITHKIDFAISRNNSQIIWIKNYFGNNVWDYLMVEKNSLPQELYLTILGSRKDVMFVEGDYDYRIYSLIFDDYNVIKIGNCENIVNYVKTFNDLQDIHYISACGIIDRDRKKQEVLDDYKQEKIYSLKLNEIENLFLIPEIITAVSKRLGKSDDEIHGYIVSTKENVLNKFREQKEEQLLKYLKEDIRNMQTTLLNGNEDNLEDFLNNYLSANFDEEKIKQVYEEYNNKFSEIVSTNDFDEALVYYSNKGLLNDSKLLYQDKLGITRDTYVNLLITCIKNDELDPSIIKNYININ